jgi:outer membrane lipoprotein-sorting protein
MNMKGLSLGFILIIISVLASGQDDSGALKILDRFSQRAISAPSVSMKFDLETIDQVEGTDNKISGTIIMSNDRYRLDLPDNTIWFNGETSWSYLPEEKEVTIAKPDKNDNSFQTRPSAVFRIYKKDYKARLLEEKTDSYLIDLYPEKLDSDHVRIRLSIGKPSLDLKGVEYKYKNGVTIMLTVKEFDLSQKPGNDTFTFQPGKYKGVEIIDMR